MDNTGLSISLGLPARRSRVSVLQVKSRAFLVRIPAATTPPITVLSYPPAGPSPVSIHPAPSIAKRARLHRWALWLVLITIVAGFATDIRCIRGSSPPLTFRTQRSPLTEGLILKAKLS